MGLSLDLNKVDNPSKVGTGGRVKPGRCHAVMTKFEEYGEPKSGCHIANWEILSHDDPSQVGKVFKDFLTDPAGASSEKGASYATERILLYCYVLGITTPEQMDAAKKGGQMPSLDLALADGRQAFIELVEEEYNNKVNTRIGNAGFDIYSMNSPSTKDFPRNAAMAARATQQAAPANGNAEASAPPATNPFGGQSQPAGDQYGAKV